MVYLLPCFIQRLVCGCGIDMKGTATCNRQIRRPWVRPDTPAFAVRLNDNFVSAIGLPLRHKCPTWGQRKGLNEVTAKAF